MGRSGVKGTDWSMRFETGMAGGAEQGTHPRLFHLFFLQARPMDMKRGHTDTIRGDRGRGLVIEGGA